MFVDSVAYKMTTHKYDVDLYSMINSKFLRDDIKFWSARTAPKRIIYFAVIYDDLIKLHCVRVNLRYVVID